MKLFVSSDCALGSRRGDVDDGFAVAALLASRAPLAAVASICGNNSESEARKNLGDLCAVAGRCEVPVLAGAVAASGPSQAARWLAARQDATQIIALGPLSDLAAALDLDPSCACRWSQVMVVGGNRRSRGRWPPVWPYEFNFTRDRSAVAGVLRAVENLTLVPLDVARRLRFGGAHLTLLEGPIGRLLRDGSRRWLRRSLWLKGRKDFPVWDLVAALAILRPDLFLLERAPLSTGLPLAAYGLADADDREVSWIAAFDAAELRQAFFALLSRAVAVGSD